MNSLWFIVDSKLPNFRLLETGFKEKRMSLSNFEHLLSRSAYTQHHDFIRDFLSPREISRGDVAKRVSLNSGLSHDHILYFAFLQEFKYYPEKAVNVELISAMVACECEKDPRKYCEILFSLITNKVRNSCQKI